MAGRKPQNRENSQEGIVLHFDENLGIGILRLRDGQRVRFTHRQIVGQGFKILFEGERVRWTGERVIPLRSPNGEESETETTA